MSVLKVEDLRKSFHQGEAAIEILKGAELTLEAGETLAILGKSGSGKSTLLSLLAGLDHPSAGQVLIDGKSISRMNEDDLARYRAEKISIVFQQFHLMSHLTALENVMLPLELRKDPGATQKARDALAKVGLSHREGHLPHQLSGGEKQRVAIARAFVTSPQVLLADEPSGSLDPETGEQVMQVLFDLVKSQRMTLVLVTHQEDLARRCRRQVRLENGLLRSLG